MEKFFKKLFGKKEIAMDTKKTPSVPLVQTTPLSDDQLKTVSGEIVQLNPPQFLIGCGQSAGLQRDHNEDAIFSMAAILAWTTVMEMLSISSSTIPLAV